MKCIYVKPEIYDRLLKLAGTSQGNEAKWCRGVQDIIGHVPFYASYKMIVDPYQPMDYRLVDE